MKKILALVLAVVLAFGMATTAFAAADKVDGIGSEALGSSGGILAKEEGLRGTYDEDDVDVSSVEARSETELWIPIYFENLSFDGKGDGAPKSLTSGVLSNIDVKKSVSKGSDVIRDIEIKHKSDVGDGAYVRVRFVEYWVSTSSKDFDFKIYLTYKSSRKSGTELQITGTMENVKEYISEDDDYYYLGDKNVVEAEDYVKSIEFDLGNGISIFTKAFEDKKYYGVAVQDITAADEAVTAKYPEIDTVYTLKTVNLKGSGNIVGFDIDDTYYVYNEEGKYIGTTSERLPYSNKYYLATKKIDMDISSSGSEEPTDEPSDEPSTTETPENPPMGGDNGVANANDNPGTGANGFVNVAVALGLVSLAAAAVSKKK